VQTISSYVVLALVAIETLVVYNVANYDAVTEFFQGHQQARQRRAEMYRKARKAAGLGMSLPALGRPANPFSRNFLVDFSCCVWSCSTFVHLVECDMGV
jgi:hypothetical protein